MKWSVRIPVNELMDPIFVVPKGFRFVFYSSNSMVKYYYRWPLHYLVKLYIKLYYWWLLHAYVKLKKSAISGR